MREDAERGMVNERWLRMAAKLKRRFLPGRVSVIVDRVIIRYNAKQGVGTMGLHQQSLQARGAGRCECLTSHDLDNCF